MNVVLVGDAAVARPIGVVVASLAAQRDALAPLRVHVLASGWSRADAAFVRAAAGDVPVEIRDASAASLPPTRAGRHVTAAAYLLLHAPRLLSQLDRALYLDADVLVRDGRVGPLWASHAWRRPVAGVRAVLAPHIGSPRGLGAWRAHGLDPHAPMVNTGVLFLDLARMRDERTCERALAFARSEGARTWLSDQAALNAALNGAWEPLPLAFNAIEPLLRDGGGAYALVDAHEVDEARRDPSIVHFAGPCKPWQACARSPFVEEWRAHAARLDWRPWPRPGGARDRLRRLSRGVRARLARRRS